MTLNTMLNRRTLLTGAAAATTMITLGACSASSGSGGGGTIRFSIWFGDGDIEVWEQIIEDFEAANPDIKVKFEPLVYENFWTKLNTQFAGGNAPDVIGMQFQQASFGPAGQLAPLDDAVSDVIDQMPETLSVIGQEQTDGGTTQFALPWRFVGGSLYANITALESVGISRPDDWTLDDFVAAAGELTTDGSWGCSVPVGGAGVALASTFGAQPVSDDGATAMYSTAEMRAYKEFVRDLVHVHRVAPNPESVSDQTDPFATDLIRMSFQGSWMTPIYRNITEFKWDILPNPSGERPAKNYAGPDMISVYAKSKNIEAAEKFVRYVVFDRAAQELIGQTGTPVLSEYLEDPARIQAEAALEPASYEYFVEQATTNGAGWAFVPKFADIQALESDADFRILESADSDIETILDELNTSAQAALDSTA